MKTKSEDTATVEKPKEKEARLPITVAFTSMKAGEFLKSKRDETKRSEFVEYIKDKKVVIAFALNPDSNERKTRVPKEFMDGLLGAFELDEEKLPIERGVIICHKFTKDELLMMGEQIADELSKLNRVEDEKKQIVSEYKAKSETIQSQINILSWNINSKQEFRRVDVYMKRDFDKGIRSYLSIPDKKELGTDRLTQDDYQLRLVFENELAEANAAAKDEKAVDSKVEEGVEV